MFKIEKITYVDLEWFNTFKSNKSESMQNKMYENCLQNYWFSSEKSFFLGK